ncbi:MAG: hypothetical protein GWO04_02585, partial [Actinobacteria bacterium]|nr:hypothetical protein [Actinomycetota bacterium]
MLGELDAKVRDELMDHVVTCDRCARLVKNLLMFDEHARRELGFTPVEPDGTEPSVEPAHRAILPGPPTLFSWPSQPGAWGYRVVLFDPE